MVSGDITILRPIGKPEFKPQPKYLTAKVAKSAKRART